MKGQDKKVCGGKADEVPGEKATEEEYVHMHSINLHSMVLYKSNIQQAHDIEMHFVF